MLAFTSKFKTLSIISLLGVLSSCGGGSGSEDNNASSDTQPDSFSFIDQTNVQQSASVTSASITVSGIDSPTSISVTGGTFNINGGSFTSTGTTVTNGDTVTVQHTSSSQTNSTTDTSLTIGGISDTFSSTTLIDSTPPSAKITFPPVVSFTAGANVTVSGTASDTLETITSVTVNGVVATSSDGFATWSASVPLSTGSNVISVSVSDRVANTDSNAAQVTITKGDISDSFPNANTPFSGFNGNPAVDIANNRLLISEYSGQSVVYAVSLATGERSIMSGPNVPDLNNNFITPRGLVIDPPNNRAFVISTGDNSIIEVNLTTGARTVISSDSVPNATNSLGSVFLALDSSRNRILGVSPKQFDTSLQNKILAISLTDGARTILSDATTPDTNNPFSNSFGIVVDETNDRALVADPNLNAILAVDLSNGVRTILSDSSTPNSPVTFSFPLGMTLDESKTRLLVADFLRKTIFSVNPSNGERTVFSSNTVPDTINPLDNPQQVVIDNTNNRIFVYDSVLKAILELDPNTGERVFISK